MLLILFFRSIARYRIVQLLPRLAPAAARRETSSLLPRGFARAARAGASRDDASLLPLPYYLKVKPRG